MDDLLRMETSLKSMQKAASLVELEKEAAKVTFSPAMDKSPLLKGKQSTLPDKIQAAILKKKKQKTKQAALAKEGSVMVSGLQQASMALYTDVYGGRMEKVANPFAFMNVGRGVAKSGLGGALIGALGGGAREAARLRKLQMAGAQAHAATRKLALEAKKAREVAQASGQRWAPGLGAEGRALSRAEADAAFLDRVAPLQKMKNVARDGAIPPQNMALPTNVMDDLPGYMKAYAPNLLRSAGETGALAGVGAAAGRYATNAYRKAQTLKRIKDAALPAAAVGAGGLGLYALTS